MHRNIQKNTIRLLAIILTLTLVLASFAACSKPTEPSDTSSSDTSSSDTSSSDTSSSDTSSSDNTQVDIVASRLNGVELENFVIVYSDEDTAYSKRAAQYIQSQIKNRTGLELSLVEDDTAVAQYEIVVGETSRPISSRLEPVSRSTQFRILAEDTKIALEGEYFVIAAAAYYFINTYVPKDDFEAQIPKQVSTHDPIVKKATNFILMIGDGMGVNSTRLFEALDNNYEYSDGEDVFYGYYLPYQGFARTRSITGVTDSAAAGTALATGTRTLNGNIAQDKNYKNLQSLTELAGSLGKSTAVMSTEPKLGATPAAFSAHASSRNSAEDILSSQQELVKTYGTIIDCDYDHYDEAGVEKLRNAITGNLNTIGANENGFFMMYEEAFIDKYNHYNNIEKAFSAVVRFNQAIGLVMEYAFYHPNTFVLITSDHETGGLTEDFNYSYEDHTGEDVAVFVYGNRGDYFKNTTVENTQIGQAFATFMGVVEFGE